MILESSKNIIQTNLGTFEAPRTRLKAYEWKFYVKDKQEKDKTRTKPDKIKQKQEAWKSPAISWWVPDFEDDSDEMSYDSLNDDKEPGGEASIQNEMDNEGSVEEIPDTCFDEVLSKQNMNDNFVNQNNSHSEDPFGIYEAIDMNVEKQDNVKDGFQRDTNESNCSGSCGSKLRLYRGNGGLGTPSTVLLPDGVRYLMGRNWKMEIST
nr:hypothetical protein [Tanacetum cinerariifolium]